MNRYIPGTFLALCVILALFYPATGLANTDEAIAEAIEILLNTDLQADPHYQNFDPIACDEEFKAFYQKRNFKPIWIENSEVNDRATVAREYIENSYLEGLRPEKYGIRTLNDLWQQTDALSLAKLDLLLTMASMSYFYDSSFGRIQPSISNPDLFPEAGVCNLSPYLFLQEIITSADPSSYFAGLQPQHQFYTFLKIGLSRYLSIKAGGGWPVIEAGKTLRPGDSDEKIPHLRRRLLIEGDYREIRHDDGDLVYDAELIEAVRVFQQRHGLKSDGIIGKETYRQLQSTVDAAIEKITINLARWRWMDHDLGSNYVLVNIANFDLIGVKENETDLHLSVVVGANRHQTPVFSSLIQYVEFNPFWTIPVSIATKEELPALRKDPYHLQKRNVRLLSGWEADAHEIDSTKIDWLNVSERQMRSYVLRQDPGPGNALGYIKFVFPNNYSIYLHDTPHRNLFAENRRNFSHGCIRVSTPELLADFLLRGPDSGWDKEKIMDAISTGKNRVEILPVKMPIHLTYQTAWGDAAGTVHFNADIYDRDKALLKALDL